MLKYQDVMQMFSGIKLAAVHNRDLSPQERIEAANDVLKIVASVVDSLTKIAESKNRGTL